MAYYLHHSPWWFHRFETLSNHFIELLVPFFLFLGRRACIIHGALQILFQVSPRRPPAPVSTDAGPSPYFWLPCCLGGPWGITGPLSWGQPVLPSHCWCQGLTSSFSSPAGAPLRPCPGLEAEGLLPRRPPRTGFSQEHFLQLREAQTCPGLGSGMGSGTPRPCVDTPTFLGSSPMILPF